MMPFMNEAISILMQKVDRISKTGENIDFHRSLQYTQFKMINVEGKTEVNKP